MRAVAIGGGQQVTVVVVELVANGLGPVNGDIQQQIAVAGPDGKRLGEPLEAR